MVGEGVMGVIHVMEFLLVVLGVDQVEVEGVVMTIKCFILKTL